MNPNTICIGFHEKDKKKRSTFSLEDENLYSYKNSTNKKITNIIAEFSENDNDLKIKDHKEFIDILNDIISLKKNLIIMRNFENLDKKLYFNQNFFQDYNYFDFKKKFKIEKKKYIDLYPLIFDENRNKANDANTYSLVFQIGWLSSKVSEWSKNYNLRCVSFVDKNSDIQNELKRIKLILYQNRMKANVVILSLESNHNFTIEVDENNYEKNENELINYSLGNKNVLSNAYGYDDNKNLNNESNDLLNNHNLFSKDEFSLISNKERINIINNIIKNNSQETDVIIFPINEPPSKKENYNEYYETLNSLTDGLPPSLMIYANQNVINIDF
jgi:hypothetical protein